MRLYSIRRLLVAAVLEAVSTEVGGLAPFGYASL